MIYNPKHRPHLCAAKTATRYAIQGVAVHQHPDGRPRMVATDGRTLVVCIGKAEDGDNIPAAPVVIPANVVEENAKGGAKHDRKLRLSECPDDGPHPATHNIRAIANGRPGVEFSGMVEDRRFPDYEAVIPKGKPTTSVLLNAKYLWNLIRAMGAESACVRLNITDGMSPVKVEPVNVDGSDAPEGFGVIMPVADGGRA